MDRNRWLRRLSLCSLSTIVVFYVIACQLGDRVWWALPFLFGPRWLLALPLIGVIPWLLVAPRRAIIPAAIATAVIVFGVLDFRVGLGRITAGGGTPLRVIELNSGSGSGGELVVADVLAEFARLSPDLIMVAECGNGPLKDAFKQLQGYHFRGSGTSLCLLSRNPIVEWDERDPTDIWKEGGSGAIVRAVIETTAGPLRVGMVHLETPRDALDNFPDLSRIPTLGNITRANTRQRDEESRAARDWILAGSERPTIVVGDFNLPIESAIFRRYWGGFRDAFSRSGLGSGHTKRTRWWGVRIDHILTSTTIASRRSFLGRDVGSDHLPLVADLVLPTGR